MRYTASAHALVAPAAPLDIDDARGLATQRARLFGVAEVVVVERNRLWGRSAGTADARVKAGPPDYRPTRRTRLRLVECVHRDGSVQLQLGLRVIVHPPQLTLCPPVSVAPVAPAVLSARQMPLFPE